MEHVEVRQKFSAARCVFKSLLGFFSGDETLMLDILLEHLSEKKADYLSVLILVLKRG